MHVRSFSPSSCLRLLLISPSLFNFLSSLNLSVLFSDFAYRAERLDSGEERLKTPSVTGGNMPPILGCCVSVKLSETSVADKVMTNYCLILGLVNNRILFHSYC